MDESVLAIEDMEYCMICGKQLSKKQLSWSDISDQSLCSDCAIEEEGCGCADD
ncbi:MAG: hypothetical protein OEM02_05440 [Desulfobulbaceae bacterium]|nr:hypothetical protein [Desulfobulbaceae bacterium]